MSKQFSNNTKFKAMRLRKISPDFTPLHQGLFFGIESETEEPTDIVVEIIDATTDEVIAMQQLRSVVSAEINVAPYIERFAEYAPSHTSTMFKDAPTRACAIRVEDRVSETLLISTNKSLCTAPAVVTTMAEHRHIAFGERDELLLLVEAGDRLVASISTNTGDNMVMDYTTATGAVVLTIATDDCDSEAHYFDVKILRNNTPFASLCYTVRAHHKRECRLAWISEAGSIERYTFPIVAKRKLKGNKLHIGAGDNRRMVRSMLESNITLISRYEPSATVEALAQIIASPKVWIEQSEGSREVMVLTSTIESDLFGEPTCIALDISEWSREEAEL